MTQTLEETRQAAAGPVTLGIHCCGNTDWSLLLNAPIDILSFDSYGYFESLRLYDRALAQYLARGGWLAWGLVPTGRKTLSRRPRTACGSVFRQQVTQLAEDLKLGAQGNPVPVPPHPGLRDGLHEPGRRPPGVDHPQGAGHPGPGVAGVPLAGFSGRSGTDSHNSVNNLGSGS